MRVKVVLGKRSDELEMEEGATVESVMAKLGLYPDAHIAVRGRTPVPLNEALRDGDELRIIKVASGG